MKILKPGNSDDNLVMRGTCVYCGCEVEVLKSETKLRCSPYSDDYYVTCPTEDCKYPLYVTRRN